jgi:hypothetical protein
MKALRGVWLSCWTNLRESDRTNCGNVAQKGRLAMPKMEIDVPEQLIEVWKAMAEQLAELERTMGRQSGDACPRAM